MLPYRPSPLAPVLARLLAALLAVAAVVTFGQEILLAGQAVLNVLLVVGVLCLDHARQRPSDFLYALVWACLIVGVAGVLWAAVRTD